MQIGGAHPARDAVQLGVVPDDGERDGGVEQRAEVVGVVRVFPEVIRVDQQELAERLLETGVELVADSRLRWAAPTDPNTFCARPPRPVALESSRFSLNGVSNVRA